MSLVIECDSCNSRYRLDLALVKGYGIRVACRKCGAAIIVLSSEVAALPTTEPKAAQAPVPKPEPERSLPKESPVKEWAEAPPEAAGKPVSLLRDILFPPPSSPPPPPPASGPGSLSFPEPAAPKEVPREPVFLLPAEPPWFLHPPVIALAVLVLLLAGIAGFITFTDSGQKALVTAVSAVQSLWRP
jgi:predicted Zn finger-like uncharacterized protein